MNNEDTTRDELATLYAQLGAMILERHGPGEKPKKPVGPLNLVRYNMAQIIELMVCEEGTADPRLNSIEATEHDARKLLDTLSTPSDN